MIRAGSSPVNPAAGWDSRLDKIRPLPEDGKPGERCENSFPARDLRRGGRARRCPVPRAEPRGLGDGVGLGIDPLSGPADPLLGFRFLPAVAYERAFPGEATLRFEASVDLFGKISFPSGGDVGFNGRVHAYRGWVRYATPRFEARVGLQRLDFGSASILRPLMWFDRLDPRDPLQITDGVNGLLLKYTFQNNANVWAWGLYGNNGLKGWDPFPTARRQPEFGGRVQLPVPRGEVALTYHHRRADTSTVNPGIGRGFPEDRIGLDGKWDLGVGLWFEGTLVKAAGSVLPLPFQRALTVGADYTFGLGNGLNVLAEHFLLQDAATAFGAGQGMRVSALSLSYPLSVLDALSGIFYYDWGNRRLYRFLSWRRTYDRWSFHLIGFWNPETFDIYRPGPAGLGLRRQGDPGHGRIQLLVPHRSGRPHGRRDTHQDRWAGQGLPHGRAEAPGPGRRRPRLPKGRVRRARRAERLRQDDPAQHHRLARRADRRQRRGHGPQASRP